MKKLSLFERVITEAPDDPPDIPKEDTPPPDIPSDLSTQDEGPPDIPNESEGDASGDIDSGEPPDLDGDFGGEEPEGLDDQSFDGEGDERQSLEIDEKISAVMNQQLYQRFLALLNNITSQLSMIKNNSDVLFTLSTDSLDIIDSLKKLEENVRLYLKNYFLNENYSKNLLFFNKCLNLLKLLNEIFDKNIQKGIRSME